MRRSLDLMLGVAVGLAGAAWWATSYRFDYWREVPASGPCAAYHLKETGFSLPVMLLGIVVVATLLLGRIWIGFHVRDDGKPWGRTLLTVGTCAVVILGAVIALEGVAAWPLGPYLDPLYCYMR